MIIKQQLFSVTGLTFLPSVRTGCHTLSRLSAVEGLLILWDVLWYFKIKCRTNSFALLLLGFLTRSSETMTAARVNKAFPDSTAQFQSLLQSIPSCIHPGTCMALLCIWTPWKCLKIGINTAFLWVVLRFPVNGGHQWAPKPAAQLIIFKLRVSFE